MRLSLKIIVKDRETYKEDTKVYVLPFCAKVFIKTEGMSQLKIVKLLIVVNSFSLEILVKQCPIHQG